MAAPLTCLPHTRYFLPHPHLEIIKKNASFLSCTYMRGGAIRVGKVRHKSQTWQEAKRGLFASPRFTTQLIPYGRTNTWFCSNQSTHSWSRRSCGLWKSALTCGSFKKYHVSLVLANRLKSVMPQCSVKCRKTEF